MDIATVDHLLTTTRSVRRRLNLHRPVEPEIIERCIEIATQAPTASNRQGWRFLVITDAAKRAQVAEFYRQSFAPYIAGAREKQAAALQANPDDQRAQQNWRVGDSAEFLAEHLHEVPVHIIPCIQGRVEGGDVVEQASLYGSILPAVWSLMLALRARGLGAAWTTLHLRYEKEVAALLGIPATVTQAALLPVAYFTGDDFQPAQRRTAREVTFWNGWGQTR